MALFVDWVAVDCREPRRVADFWREALNLKTLYSSDDDPDNDEDEFLLGAKDGAGTRLLFLRVPDEKAVKNRLHLDLRGDDQEAEVKRLEGLGATKIDIGQGEVSWVVMADPEGNEFCVLRNLSETDRAERASW